MLRLSSSRWADEVDRRRQRFVGGPMLRPLKEKGGLVSVVETSSCLPTALIVLYGVSLILHETSLDAEETSESRRNSVPSSSISSLASAWSALSFFSKCQKSKITRTKFLNHSCQEWFFGRRSRRNGSPTTSTEENGSPTTSTVENGSPTTSTEENGSPTTSTEEVGSSTEEPFVRTQICFHKNPKDSTLHTSKQASKHTEPALSYYYLVDYWTTTMSSPAAASDDSRLQLPVGTRVCLVDLQSASAQHLNNQMGCVATEFNAATGRYGVCLESNPRQTVNVKPANLVAEPVRQTFDVVRAANASEAHLPAIAWLPKMARFLRSPAGKALLQKLLRDKERAPNAEGALKEVVHYSPQYQDRLWIRVSGVSENGPATKAIQEILTAFLQQLDSQEKSNCPFDSWKKLLEAILAYMHESAFNNGVMLEGHSNYLVISEGKLPAEPQYCGLPDHYMQLALSWTDQNPALAVYEGDRAPTAAEIFPDMDRASRNSMVRSLETMPDDAPSRNLLKQHGNPVNPHNRVINAGVRLDAGDMAVIQGGFVYSENEVAAGDFHVTLYNNAKFRGLVARF